MSKSLLGPTFLSPLFQKWENELVFLIEFTLDMGNTRKPTDWSRNVTGNHSHWMHALQQ